MDLASFKEDILIADTKLNFGIESRHQILKKPSKDLVQNCIKNDHEAIILGIIDFFKKTKNKCSNGFSISRWPSCMQKRAPILSAPRSVLDLLCVTLFLSVVDSRE